MAKNTVTIKTERFQLLLTVEKPEDDNRRKRSILICNFYSISSLVCKSFQKVFITFTQPMYCCRRLEGFLTFIHTIIIFNTQ